MTAALVAPLPFTSSATGLNGTLVSNMNKDKPGYVWRGTGSFIVDLGPNPVSYDVIALIGSNLRASDTVRITTGTTSAGTGAHNSGTHPALVGSKASASTTNTVHHLSQIRTERYVRVEFTSTGLPYVEVQRLVVGRAALTDAITHNAEVSWERRKDSEDENDKQPPVRSMKITTGNIDNSVWRAVWEPVMSVAHKPLLLVPFLDDVGRQQEAVFGDMAKSSATLPHLSQWRVEATVTALSH